MFRHHVSKPSYCVSAPEQNTIHSWGYMKIGNFIKWTNEWINLVNTEYQRRHCSANDCWSTWRLCCAHGPRSQSVPTGSSGGHCCMTSHRASRVISGQFSLTKIKLTSGLPLWIRIPLCHLCLFKAEEENWANLSYSFQLVKHCSNSWLQEGREREGCGRVGKKGWDFGG